MFANLAKAGVNDFRAFDIVRLQVVGLSGGDTITVFVSLDGTNWVQQSLIGNDLSTTSTISSNGVYQCPAGCYLKWTQTGTASSPSVKATGAER